MKQSTEKFYSNRHPRPAWKCLAFIVSLLLSKTKQTKKASNQPTKQAKSTTTTKNKPKLQKNRNQQQTPGNLPHFADRLNQRKLFLFSDYLKLGMYRIS